MKQKLTNFNEFANLLFPHEVDYLLSVQNFATEENLKILNLINYNSKNPLNTLPFDGTIDKRKYSYMKKWIVKCLNNIDVDLYFDWLIKIEKQIMIDSILPDEEKELLDMTKKIFNNHYYFIRFYELLQHYRDYLLIRVRNQYYEPIEEYLEKYQTFYLDTIEINKKLNIATIEIIKQHSSNDIETIQWEDFLKEIFFDSYLDGFTRYRAVVRLTFLYYNYREFDKLKSVYNSLDRMFKTEVFYSKRILANYYANRAMMHLKLNELAEAEKYGYLSVRQHNSDFLLYLVNLCGVLLKSEKNNQAYKLMSSYIPELKKTNSFYYKIGFVAYYIKTLLSINLVEKAVNYAEIFFESNKKEVLKYRWHMFFGAYIRALFKAEKFEKIISIYKRYDLINKEKQFIGKARYLPIIFWYVSVSTYMLGNISEKNLCDIIMKSSKELKKNDYKSSKIIELLLEFSGTIPQIVKKIKTDLSS